MMDYNNSRKKAGALFGLGIATAIFVFTLGYLLTAAISIEPITVPGSVPIEVVGGVMFLALMLGLGFVNLLLSEEEAGDGPEEEGSDGRNGDEATTRTDRDEETTTPGHREMTTENESSGVVKRANIENDTAPDSPENPSQMGTGVKPGNDTSRRVSSERSGSGQPAQEGGSADHQRSNPGANTETNREESQRPRANRADERSSESPAGRNRQGATETTEREMNEEYLREKAKFDTENHSE